MSVTLTIGQKLSLNKNNPGLKKITVGFGKAPYPNDNNAAYENHDSQKAEMIDWDSSAFMLTAANKVAGPKDFIFYGNLSHPSGAVLHKTNTPDKNDFDKEKIVIDLSLLPSDIAKIAFTVTIYDADARKQNLSQVKNIYIRIYNEQTNEEILRYNFAENFTVETAVVLGEIYKNNREWKFNAMGKGSQGGLEALCGIYGVEVE